MSLTHRLALLVDAVDGHARGRAAQRGRLERADRQRQQETAHDLGAAGDVDDGEAAAADVIEEPEVRIRIPGLSGGAEVPEAREVEALGTVRALLHQEADGGGGDPEVGDAELGADLPKAARVRPVGDTLVEDDRGAEEVHADELPGPHHPADVGDPEEHVVRLDVECVAELLGHLRQDAAVRVDGSLRSARGARGEDHQRALLGVEALGGIRRGASRDEVLPPDVSTRGHGRCRCRPGRGVPRPGDRRRRSSRGRGRARGAVGLGLDRQGLAAPHRAVGGEQHTHRLRPRGASPGLSRRSRRRPG